MKVLVTGANGFIGSHLIELLLQHGAHVTAMVRASSDLTTIAPLATRYNTSLRLAIADLRNPATLQIDPDVEVIYHLGAVLMSAERSDFFDTNAGGTRYLLEAIVQANPTRLRRFVYASSQAAAGPSPTEDPLDETAPLNPVSWYGESKRDAEAIVHGFEKRGIPVTIVRPVGVYGERETLLANSTFPVVRAGFLPQIGFGPHLAGFVYIGDLVRALYEIPQREQTLGRTYFLSNPKSYRPLEVMRAIAESMHTLARIPIVVPVTLLKLAAPLVEAASNLSGTKPVLTRDKVREVKQRFWAATPEAAHRDFGWVAKFSLEEGMVRTMQYRAEQDRKALEFGIHQSLHDRALKTFSIAGLAALAEALIDLPFGGVTLDGFAHAIGLPSAPWWLTAGAIFLVFGVVMGFIALWTAGHGKAAQFLAGAAGGAGLELANQLALHWWTWSPTGFGRIPGPWPIALALGIPAGLYPLVIDAVVGMMYRRQMKSSTAVLHESVRMAMQVA